MTSTSGDSATSIWLKAVATFTAASLIDCNPGAAALSTRLISSIPVSTSWERERLSGSELSRTFANALRTGSEARAMAPRPATTGFIDRPSAASGPDWVAIAEREAATPAIGALYCATVLNALEISSTPIASILARRFLSASDTGADHSVNAFFISGENALTFAPIARSTSATWLAHSTSAPPPFGSTRGSASMAPMSRRAALTRSSAPASCFFNPAAAPPYACCIPFVR